MTVRKLLFTKPLILAISRRDKYFQTQFSKIFSSDKNLKFALSAQSAGEFNKDIEMIEQRSFDCFGLRMTVLQIVAYKVVDIGNVMSRQIFFKHN
ncbi:MAG TPA: hypothetical protein DCQ50_16385 [Chryseobacterium sp.]|nr:hypothetical protein [Chryseobacterium sp.]